MNIVFFGTTEFSTHILNTILSDGNFNISSVVTIPDKSLGRGLKKTPSEVKKYALSKNLNILQPDNLKDKIFIDNLIALNADVFIVVAFKFLPKELWQIVPTFNLHTSLLPQYRGAAPIERAIMNGESETGVTTFLLQNKIDTGDILIQKKVAINIDDNAKSLKEKLLEQGASAVIETLNMILNNKVKPTPQDIIIANNKKYFSELKYANKLDKSDFIINWDNSSENIYNQIRALSDIGAYSDFGHIGKLKIFRANILISHHNYKVKDMILESKNRLYIASKDGFIEPLIVQMESKKPMKIADFLNGYRNKINFVNK